MNQDQILLLQAGVFMVQTLVLAITGLVFWRQLVALNRTNESTSHSANLQSVLTYYQLVIDNPRIYATLFDSPSTTDDEIRARYTAFALLRIFDNWFIQHDHGSFPRSKGDELWRAWEESAEDAIARSGFLKALMRKYDYAYSRSLRACLKE